MRRAIAAIASLIVFGSFAVGCSSGNGNEGDGSESSGGGRMTVAEYARWCGDNGEDGSAAGLTWGEYADEVQDLVDEARSVENQIPDEASLLTFHRASRGALESIRDFARQQDEDEIFNAFALLTVALVADASVNTAADSLSPSTRTALVSTGCIEEDQDSAE